jgi:3-deoxy-D-manno-octulosonic-acid transferase
MYFVYSLVLTLGFLILTPRFLFDALRHGKYVAGFRERLGLLSPIKHQGQPVIWLHCVSVGETQAARTLVEGLRERFPNYFLAVSTITSTGQNLAREVFKNQDAKVFYFPFDWPWTVRRALRMVKPAAVLIMETELWPGFLRECRAQQIPVAIINGRLSEQSFRRYRFIKGFISRVLQCLDLAVMQTGADAERIRRLGLDSDKISISGTLKFDAGIMPPTEFLTEEFRLRFNPDDSPLILAASTHRPEERIVLEAFQQIRSEASTRPRLMIAPRHPERFAEVARMIGASGLQWTSRTAPPASGDWQCDVILLDTIGELRSAYALASIVLVGGSIARTGGHNILEPAAVGACIVTGAHTHNFEVIVNTFAKAGAIIQLPPMPDEEAGSELGNVFHELLANPQRQQELGRRARRLVEKNRGATEHTLRLLTPMLAAQSSAPTPGTRLSLQGTRIR